MSMAIDQSIKFGSYDKKDVIFLLKDLSNYKLEGSVEQRERKIQTGAHYSETLPIEYQPPENYLLLFEEAITRYKQKVALCTGVVSEQKQHCPMQPEGLLQSIFSCA